VTKPVLAYVVNTLNPGGTERLVVEMGLAFSDEYDLHVFCLDEPGAWASRLRERGIPVTGLWRQKGIDLSVPIRLAAHMRRINASIIHAHQCSAWFYSALSRLYLRQPKLILEEHGRFWPEPDGALRKRVNQLLINPLTERFVAVSNDIASRLQRYEGIPSRRIQVIYNGVAPPQFPEPDATTRMRASFGIRPTEFVIGTVGRLDPIKNLPMLVNALSAVCTTHPQVKGLIVGDGPQREDIRRLIADAGMSERICMTGHRDDARALLGCMNLFVLASFSEGTSVALLEAMAAGLPAAVTAVGGNPEIVVDGVSGWVVPSGDTAALQGVFERAVSDPATGVRLGTAGRLRFEAQFTLSAMLDAYRAVYRDMLSSSGVSPVTRSFA
jgi:glycosyltransferase involved in cell wall biosynthesis